MKRLLAGTIFTGIITCAVFTGSRITRSQLKSEAKRNHAMSEKHFALFLMMNQWVRVKQQGKSIVSYLKKHGYQTVAVCGMSYVGETFLEELKGSDITVSYGIDRDVETVYSFVDVVSIEEELRPVDVIVVTAVTAFEEIRQTLEQKVECPIVSLEDILYEV